MKENQRSASNFYALMLMIGGLIGFIRKRSVASLVAGVGSGTAVVMSVHHDNLQAVQIISACLALLMSIKAAKSGRVMPAGAVAGLSAGILGYVSC